MRTLQNYLGGNNMKKELRQYQTCPDCGKDMGPDHIIGKFVEMVEIFKKDIELNKDQPKKYFEDWLVKKRSVFTAEIHKNHLICNPANRSEEHTSELQS